MSNHKAVFEIDDSAITRSGFTYRSAYPAKFTENSFILTNSDTLCVKVYSNNQTGHCFAVGFGQFFGKDWIHVASDSPFMWHSRWEEYAKQGYSKMLASAPELAQSMDKVPSEARVCVMQTRLRPLTLRTCVVWKSPRGNGVKLEVFRDPGCGYVSGEWMGFDVDVGGIFSLSVHYFRISIDITVHRKQNIKTRHIATSHSKSMTAQSPRVASPTAAHTQRNSQEIVLFSPRRILFVSKSILITKLVIALQCALDNSSARTGYMSNLAVHLCATLVGRNMLSRNTPKC